MRGRGDGLDSRGLTHWAHENGARSHLRSLTWQRHKLAGPTAGSAMTYSQLPTRALLVACPTGHWERTRFWSPPVSTTTFGEAEATSMILPPVTRGAGIGEF